MGINNGAPRDTPPLRGRGIVVTRPAGQAGRLAALIEAAGGTPILFPLIDIRPTGDAEARARLRRIADYDLVVFVSANAVAHGLADVGSHVTLPPNLLVAAVGEGTARALRERGVERVLVPSERFDSEGLVALPQLADVAGKQILIVRGIGGRELLAQTFTARGAHVEYAECYERLPPAKNADVLLAAWRAHTLHAVTITSSEALRHLHALLPEEGRAALAGTTLFVTHERMRDAARALGLDDIILAPAGDEGLIVALAQHFASAG